MKKIFIFFFVCISAFAFAQQNSKVITNAEPTFPKGDDALYTYVYFNLTYSEEAKQKYVEGEVTLSFDVQTDSTTTNIIVLKGVGFGVDDELKKLISKLKFSPGIQNGVPIKMNTMYSFPIKAH
ncbi:MAG: energy transducer TonB [Bacteroidia bacterium]|nr:energy transducer TonB [Bacteroidia bacterium]